MMTLENGAAVITPDTIDGWRAEQETGTITHRIIGRADPDVTFAPAGLRAGRMRLVFADELAAADALALLAAPAVWTLNVPERPTLDGMRFVVADDRLELELEDATRNVWLLWLPFREVTA